MKKTAASYAFITQLNAVRFFAAIAIVVYHYGRWSFPFTLSALQPYVLNANTGVTLFFVLSGFIMVHVYGASLSALNARNVVAFYRARVARIVPLYVVALSLTAWSLAAAGVLVPIRSFLLQLFFLQAWIPNESLVVNFTGWSLSVEMLFYALFPLVFAAFRRLRLSAQLLATSAFWLVSNAFTAWFAYSYFPDADRANVLIKFFPLLHLNSFLIGMCAGAWFAKSKKQLHPSLILSALFFVAAFPFLLPEGMRPLFHNGLLAPPFAVLIAALARATHRLAKLFMSRPLVVGGDISYGIYILQVPVYNWAYLAYQRLGVFDALQEEGRFFLYLLLLCTAAWISLNTVERWGKRLIRGTESGRIRR